MTKRKRMKPVKAWMVVSTGSASHPTDNGGLFVVGKTELHTSIGWRRLLHGECERIARVEIREIVK